MSATRRELLGRGAIAAGAAAIPGSLLLATTAAAQQSDETDALEPIVELEQAAELAYSLAAEQADLSPETKAAFELYGRHCGAHATALSEALDQLGVDPPEAGSDPADHERLAEFDAKAPERELLEFMTGLEEELVAAYEGDTAAVEADDLVRTVAEVGASHAQVLIMLRVLDGAEPGAATALP